MEDNTLLEMKPGAGGNSETGMSTETGNESATLSTILTTNPFSSPDLPLETETQSDEQPSYSDLLAQIAEQNKQLALMTEMLNQHFQVTHQSPVNEQTAAEMFVMAPDSITSRLLAENGIRRTENG